MSELTRKQLVGSAIKLGRTRKGISQENLGRRVGADAKTIRRYEKGRVEPQGQRLLDIAKQLEIDDLSFFYVKHLEPPEAERELDEVAS